mmetsp:Transcript_24506/g.58105  ORF Transcript_24506/g.58105 Transcript_24506/m.58105 type:complete len:238 (-) Transcript_24506:2030-2743(-)
MARLRIQVHIQGEGIQAHAGGTSSYPGLERHHSASLVVGGDAIQVQLVDMSPRALESPVLDAIPTSCFWQVDRRLRLLRGGLRDAVHQQHLPQHDLILQRLLVLVSLRIIQEVPKQRADHRLCSCVPLVEQSVPQWQHLVPELQGGLDAEHRGLIEDIGLPPRCLQVSMIAQERVDEHCELIPSHGHLLVRVLEEATHISSHQGLAPQRQGSHHGNGCLQVGPLGVVVPCPNGAVLV